MIRRSIRLLSSPLLLSLFCAAISLWLFGWIAEEMLEGETRQFDAWIRAGVHLMASPTLTVVMRALTWAGSVVFLIPATLSAVLGLWFAGRRRRAVLVLVTMLGAAFLLFVLKMSFHRTRPEPFFDTPLPASYAFPSGHAMLSSCLYGVMGAFAAAHQNRRRTRAAIWVLTAVLVFGIGISRIYLGVHYPSDVAAGYLAAIVWVTGVAVSYRRLYRAGA